MEKKASMTAEEMSLLKSISENEQIRALLLEELEQVSGGASFIPSEDIVVDMSVYHCVYYSMALGRALMFKYEGMSREEALRAVFDYYHETLHLVMNNLDQCITQEEWDRYK